MTAFVMQGSDFDPQPWWESVAKELAEQQSFSPRQKVSRYEGRWKKGKLALLSMPSRIDWWYSEIELQDQTQAVGQEVMLGRWAEVETLFSESMRGWLKSSPPLSRLAFGAVLNSPIEDRESGYRRLQSLLPSVKIDPKGSRDLLYQINRPRKSALGLFPEPLNRLSTWSVLRRSAVALELTTSDERTSASTNVSTSTELCRLILDMSTPSEHTSAIPKDQLGNVLSELSKMAAEIATKGDVK